jgi:hypothetical protein
MRDHAFKQVDAVRKAYPGASSNLLLAILLHGFIPNTQEGIIRPDVSQNSNCVVYFIIDLC